MESYFIIDDFGMNILNEIKNGVQVSKFYIDDKIIKEYLKWISYVPEWFNLEELRKKGIENLSEKEAGILGFINRDMEYQKIFERYLSSDKKMPIDLYRIYNYIRDVSIDDYARIKLSNTDFCYCEQVIVAYYGTSIDEYVKEIEILEHKSKRTMVEEYILYYFKDIVDSFNKETMTNDISLRKRIMS